MLPLPHDVELDRGTRSVAAGSERTCALTRELKSVAELVRFVVAPDGELVPDVKRKLPGRGVWISATRAAVEQAGKRDVFARAFRRSVRIRPDLAAETERLLERSALDALAIAGKAGLVLVGRARIESAAGEDFVAVIHASDAANDGKRKINAVLRRNRTMETAELDLIDLFTGAQLDLALSRPNVVHAALLAGPASETFLARAARLQRFRTESSPAAASVHALTDGARGHSTE